MPWRQVDAMVERFPFIPYARQRLVTFTDLCALHGVTALSLRTQPIGGSTPGSPPTRCRILSRWWATRRGTIAMRAFPARLEALARSAPTRRPDLAATSRATPLPLHVMSAYAG